MRSLILSVTTAVVLLATVVPGAQASEPTGTDAPAAVEEPTPTPTAEGPYDGTIVVDPTFVSGGELPTQPPTNGTAPTRPTITPPPTDAAVGGGAPNGTSLQVPLLLLATIVAVGALLTPGRARRRAGRR